MRQAERDAGVRSGPTTDERQRVKELEREVRELKRANQILRKASACFAQAETRRETQRPVRKDRIIESLTQISHQIPLSARSLSYAADA